MLEMPVCEGRGRGVCGALGGQEGASSGPLRGAERLLVDLVDWTGGVEQMDLYS